MSRTGARAACTAVLFAIVAGAPSFAVAAQEPGDAYELGPIVVTAPTVAVASATVVTEQDIARRGARTLDEALALLPGVSIHTGGDGVPRIDVRGLRPRQVRVLVNGVPLNSTYDGQFDPTMIPTEDIASITLTTAASSVLYGGGGEVGGVINIQTRRGTGTLRLTQGGAEGGTGDARRAWLVAAGRNARVDGFLSASSARRDGFPTASGFSPTGSQGTGLRDNSYRRREAVYANAGFRPTAAWRLGAALNHVRGAQGIPPSAISDPSDIFANPARYERLPYQRSDAGQLAASFAPGGAWQVRSWAYGTDAAVDDDRYDDDTYTSMSDSTQRGTFRLHSTFDIVGVHLEPRRALGGTGTIGLALDWERDRWDQTGVIRDVAVGGGGGGGGARFYRVRGVDQRRLIRMGGAGIEYTGTPFAGLGITLGYRTQWQSPFSLATQRADIAVVAARYDVGTRTGLRVVAAQRARFPSIRQLYDAGSGDSTLSPERANTFELGVERAMGARTSVGVTLYQNDVRDYIEVDETTRRSANFPRYRFRGMDIAGETRLWSRLQVRFGYGYLDAKNLSPGSGTTALQYRPRHRATLAGTLRPGAGFTAYGSVQYVAGQVHLSRSLPRQTAELPDYTVVDARCSRDFARLRLTLYVGVRNLLDRRYETSYGFPEPGRVWYAGAMLAP